MIEAIEGTGNALAAPLIEIWNVFVSVLPGLIAAVLILIFGYLLGALIGHVIKNLLKKSKIVSLIIKRVGLQEEIGKWDLEGFIGLIIKWYIFIVFLNPAASVVGMYYLSQFFKAAALWIPNIILAIVIILVGYVLAEYIAKKVKETKAKKSSLLADLAKIITLVFVILMAMRQIGVEVSVAENSFLIVLAGIMLGLAIAFGLGCKDEVREIMKEVRKRI